MPRTDSLELDVERYERILADHRRRDADLLHELTHGVLEPEEVRRVAVAS